MAPALGTVGIPLDGLGVLIGVDRIPDMARTALNVEGILVAATVLDRIIDSDGPASRTKPGHEQYQPEDLPSPHVGDTGQ